MVGTHKKGPSPTPVFEGIRMVVEGDLLYPKNLSSVQHVTYHLYYRGALQPSDTVAVAVIGSRNCSSQGAQAAFDLSAQLARAGITVVSGLAHGIDQAAHRGALSVRGRTLAVLGTGLNEIYPPEHYDLSVEICQSGALLSQFDPGFPGSPRGFLRRNHVITGMAQVVVVAEAQLYSGTASALKGALAQGRPVGLLRSLVESAPWAADLVDSGQAFAVDSAEDIIKRVEF